MRLTETEPIFRSSSTLKKSNRTEPRKLIQIKRQIEPNRADLDQSSLQTYQINLFDVNKFFNILKLDSQIQPFTNR